MNFYDEEKKQRQQRIKNLEKYNKIAEAQYNQDLQKSLQGSVPILNDHSNDVQQALIKESNENLYNDPNVNKQTAQKFLEKFANREDAKKIIDTLLSDDEIAFIVKTQPELIKEMNKYTNLTPQNFVDIVNGLRNLNGASQQGVTNLTASQTQFDSSMFINQDTGVYDDLTVVLIPSNRAILMDLNRSDLKELADNFIKDGALIPAAVYKKNQNGSISKSMYPFRDVKWNIIGEAANVSLANKAARKAAQKAAKNTAGSAAVLSAATIGPGATMLSPPPTLSTVQSGIQTSTPPSKLKPVGVAPPVTRSTTAATAGTVPAVTAATTPAGNKLASKGKGLMSRYPTFHSLGLGLMTDFSDFKRESTNQVHPKNRYPKIFGKGMKTTVEQDKKFKAYREYYDKVYIDLKKLENNILFCKYIANNTNIPRLKTQSISNDLKELIKDVINDKYNKKLYSSLNDDDKRVFKIFNKCFKFDLDIPADTQETEFKTRYNILLGSYYSGNDSNELKTELKKYVRLGLSQGLINQTDAYSVMYELI